MTTPSGWLNTRIKIRYRSRFLPTVANLFHTQTGLGWLSCHFGKDTYLDAFIEAGLLRKAGNRLDSMDSTLVGVLH